MQDDATKEGTTRTLPSFVYQSRSSFQLVDQMEFEPNDKKLRSQPLSAPTEIKRGFHQAPNPTPCSRP
jgi:hypothetical protein